MFRFGDELIQYLHGFHDSPNCIAPSPFEAAALHPVLHGPVRCALFFRFKKLHHLAEFTVKSLESRDNCSIDKKLLLPVPVQLEMDKLALEYPDPTALQK